ncbi:hypothetical protein [Alkalihalobacillus sp. TS-13]|nr:hypothetical protein [Alkalihalobacillus sp. TS-13]
MKTHRKIPYEEVDKDEMKTLEREDDNTGSYLYFKEQMVQQDQ